MKRNEAFPSQYLSQIDVDPPVVATIAAVQQEELTFGDEKELKMVMHFQDGVKSLVLNGTNWDATEEMYGDDSDDWVGCKVELYKDPKIKFGGKLVGGVRVRAPKAGMTPNPSSPHKTTPAILLWGQALELAAQAGMSEDDLKAAIKALGMVEYKPSRDGEIVRRLLSVRFAQKLEADKAAGQEGAGFTADDVDGTIPF